MTDERTRLTEDQRTIFPAWSCARTWSSRSRATPSCPPMCWNTCWASTAPPRRGQHPVRHRDGQGDPAQALCAPQRGRPGPLHHQGEGAAQGHRQDQRRAERKDATSTRPTFSNLGIKKVLVDSDTVKRHPKLLVSGVWCICRPRVPVHRGQERQPLDPGHAQADPALALRLRSLSGGPSPVHAPTSGSTC